MSGSRLVRLLAEASWAARGGGSADEALATLGPAIEGALGATAALHDGVLELRRGDDRLILTADSPPPASGAFDPEEVEAAAALAQLLAAIADREQLFLQVLRSNTWLARLDDLSRAIVARTDIPEIVDAAADGLAELFSADAVAIYSLVDGLPELTAQRGPEADFDELVAVCGADGRNLLGRPADPSLLLGATVNGGRHQFTLVLPGSEGMDGVLAVQRPADLGPFDPDALPLLSAIAGHLATALSNARLVAEMRRLAAFDDLTGLAGRRHFATELERELDRARRELRPLSVLMIDADHFKAVNDVYGHAAGDAVLIALADSLKHCTRSLDVVGRLGGEELGVLLPGADAQIALMVAGRLRAAIEKLRVPWRGDVVRVTVSIGVATWDASLTGAALLDRADQALYRAKSTGRNRVVAWADERTA